MTEPTRSRELRRTAIYSAIAGCLLLYFLGCPAAQPPLGTAAAANDRTPDPQQPFPHMNKAGVFLTRGRHAKPPLVVPPGADAKAVARAVERYTLATITDETRRLYTADTIARHVTGATQAGAAAYAAAVAANLSPAQAAQAAQVASTTYLHDQGVMGP